MTLPTTSSAPSAEAGDARKSRLLKFAADSIRTGSRGVEIGPYDRPLLTRPDFEIQYADVQTTETLRDLATQNPRRFPEKVVQVDFVIGEKSLAELIDGRGIGYVFGSHVYEHIPNLLGFLRDIANVIGPSGRIIGAYPDRRYTFDIDRPRTTLGQLIDRDLRGLTQPDMASVFDHFFHFRALAAGRIWNFGADHGVARSNTIHNAMAETRKSASQYVDVHCNLFTDDEFIELVDAIHELGVPLKLRAIEPTKRPLNEFFFCLEVTD